ncbi:tRNA (guanine(37)-N1)-methyltransferase [Pleurostoma richardsiae]|uniref:tRNA (guanine(37)-N1)-methyltransferase n=1 Tax=Pleurostoma richardsiae TaxID=41990 RepID=A0AA38SCT5_9PEZI|nr:tRNA (guanine(37)-N1)-methyltransferase [Pleurostoma richardsiae]
MTLIRPPVLRSSGAVLNKALFAQTYNIAAAAVSDNKNISKYRKALDKSRDILRLERVSNIAPHPDASLASQGRKCLLLRPGISPDNIETWSPILREAVKQEDVGVIPYELKLGYDYWDPRDVLQAILPEELHDDIPTGFNTAGHVAHLNLREHHLPYKKLIGEVILDKNRHIRTVINKVDNVGTESQFRTFAYEVLAGPDDMNVEVREGECVFHFDYSKVYWNSKLEAEHRRIASMFNPGEVACDVMAGIGPFAVPAARKGVFVWANDMNPESYHYLKDAIARNKVSHFVRPFNEDGRSFITRAADSVLAASRNGEHALVYPKPPPRSSKPQKKPEPVRVPVPPTISHFVMNLPASAITFLPHYRGLYAGREELFAPHTQTRLPMVHVHCFALKSDDEVPRIDICERLTEQLGVTMREGDPENEFEVAIHDVRDVAPAKRMFCASFRLPAEVAFASRT